LSAPRRSAWKHRIQREPGSTPPHVIDRTRQLMGEDGEGLALAVFVPAARARRLAGGMGPHAPDGRCGEGPLAGGVAHVGARGPIPLASRGVGALHQPARGDERLPPGTAREVMECIPPHEGQHRATPRARAQAVAERGLGRLGGVDKSARTRRQAAVVGVEHRQVHRDARLAGGIGAACRAPLPGGLVGELRADFGPIVLTGGLLDMRQQGRAWAQERHPPPPQVPGGPQLGGIHVRLGAHPPTQPPRKLGGLDVGGVGLAPGNGRPGARMAEDTREACLGTPVGPPVPREESIRPRRRSPRERAQ